jgi:hypothetical protein
LLYVAALELARIHCHIRYMSVKCVWLPTCSLLEKLLRCRGGCTAVDLLK